LDIPKNKVARIVTDFKVDGATALPVKILDITAAVDDAAKTCDISAHVPPNTIAVLLCGGRVGGAGTLGVFPNQSTLGVSIGTYGPTGLIPITGQLLKYKKSASGDDWDLYLVGYVIEGPVGK